MEGKFIGARLDRDRDGLLVFFVGVVLLRATAPLNPSTKRLVSAPLPVLALAGLIAISGLTPNTPFLVIVGQWGGAGGAICEDHLAFCGELLGFAAHARLEKPVFYASIRGVHQHRNRNTVYHTLPT